MPVFLDISEDVTWAGFSGRISILYKALREAVFPAVPTYVKASPISLFRERGDAVREAVT